MRCSRCGNDNPEGNRFCGMCGASMFLASRGGQSSTTQSFPATSGQAPAGTTSSPVVASEPTAPLPRAAASGVNQTVAASAPESRDQGQSVISGPSFLGLDKPGAASSKQSSTLGLDPHTGRTSRNLDYLLEDDEAPKGGSGKFVLILLALALALGFGYLRWRSGGMAWLTSVTKKPPAAASDSGQGTTDSASSSTAPPAGQTAASGQTPVSDASQPANSAGSGNRTASNVPVSSPNAAGGIVENPAANAPAATQPPSNADSGGAPGSTSAAPNPASKNSVAAAKDNSATGSDDSADEDAEDQPSKPAATAASKPRAAVKPPAAKPVDTVSEAEKYIYGRGVRQDCDRGMRMLRPAAEHSNVKAMSSLGVLYSAGLCTPRDLPTSYRWIALALRKEPDNQSLKDNLQKLWGEMTQPERQLAIKLSQ